MPTRPTHEPGAIVTDARRVYAAAMIDVHEKEFSKRVSKQELASYHANIESLASGDGARTTKLHAQVASGVHTATARGLLLDVLHDIRDDAKIMFGDDTALQHAFGVGATASAGSTSQVRHLADEVLAAAHEHPHEAAKLGLDAKGLHKLEDLVHAVDGADLAHVHAATQRHSHTTHVDSLAHLVSAETAHLRLVARRVFRGNDDKLRPYAPTLPRRQVVPRKKAPAAAPKPAT